MNTPYPTCATLHPIKKNIKKGHLHFTITNGTFLTNIAHAISRAWSFFIDKPCYRVEWSRIFGWSIEPLRCPFADTIPEIVIFLYQSCLPFRNFRILLWKFEKMIVSRKIRKLVIVLRKLGTISFVMSYEKDKYYSRRHISREITRDCPLRTQKLFPFHPLCWKKKAD